MESKELTVCKDDLKNIGHTTYGVCENDRDNERTCFACNQITANVEEILLREILSLFGYKITEIMDGEKDDILIITDMPWDEYIA